MISRLLCAVGLHKWPEYWRSSLQGGDNLPSAPRFHFRYCEREGCGARQISDAAGVRTLGPGDPW